jgi:UDP-N-acetylbacillosamine N-acetyltransferase
MKEKLALIGAGGHSKVVSDIAKANGWQDIVYFDDHKKGFPTINDFIKQKDQFDGCFVSIGDNQARFEILKKLTILGVHIPTLIHPSAVLSPSVDLGVGIVVMPNVVVNADSKISDGCILNTGCGVDHDCRLESFVHICPGSHLAGNVFVDQMSWLGVGSSVIENVKIGKNVRVGAGAAGATRTGGARGRASATST